MAMDLTEFYRQLGTMLNAGVPLSRCLHMAAASPDAPHRKLAAKLERQIAAGASLAEAMQSGAGYVPAVEQKLIQVGEMSGRLDQILINLADSREAMARVRKLFIGKMVYPIVLLHVAILVRALVAFMRPDDGGLGVAILYLLEGVVPLYGLTLLLAIISWSGKRLLPVRLLLELIFYHVPFIGQAMHQVAVARFARTFGILYRAGIGVVEALPIAAEACGNSLIRRRLLRAEKSLAGGLGLAESLMETRVFGYVVNGMLMTGEESGKLDAMLEKIQEQADYDAQASICRLGAAIPALIYGVVAIWVGWQVISFFAGYKALIDDLL